MKSYLRVLVKRQLRKLYKRSSIANCQNLTQKLHDDDVNIIFDVIFGFDFDFCTALIKYKYFILVCIFKYNQIAKCTDSGITLLLTRL